jgi:NAD(P)-dependent dehydrogenase (short-subunit alcohol dehydrogenase family)
MKLKDRIAIVTGAARGIGYAITERFVADGATVIICDVEDAAGEESAKKMGASYLHCDVSKSADVNALVETVIAKHGAIDILVNNAAINIGADFLEITEELYDRVLGINLKGSFLMSQACARHMVAQVKAGRKPGAIVNMSSVNDTLTLPGFIPYCIAKGGLSQLTRATAVAFAPHGIRVNAIGPGSIMTEMFKWVVNDEAALTRVMSRTPMGRAGEPSEVASIAAFLVSDDASYVTGDTIYCDGGRLPLNYVMPAKQ